MNKAIKADTIVFDKTGTLTEGRLAVRKVLLFGGHKVSNVLKLASSMKLYLNI